MTGWPEATTLWAAWRRCVASTPDAVFLVFEHPNGTSTTWTYGSFDVLVSRVGGYLAAHDVRAGSAVHLALTNSPTFVAVWLASLGSRASIIPSDPFATANELRGHLTRTQPMVGFCSSTRATEYRIAAQGTSLVHVLEIDEADAELAVFGSGFARFDDLVAPELTDRAAVMFTSGTTGIPKGVEITQANYAFAGATMARASGLEAHHRQLVVLPLFHANAQYYSFASAIWVGASVALMSSFSASGFLAQAARYQATHASLFAAPIRMILSRGSTPVPGVSLVNCWYAMNISNTQLASMTELLGCVPRQLYGMTETIPAVLTDRAQGPVASSMGFVTAGCEVEILRPDGSKADIGEVGEIAVRGERGITLFSGYLDDPTTTSASFRTTWFLTGDRASQDHHGRFYFDGRHSDVLKVSGENVSIVEVEQVLSSHPAVLEAAVVGRADEVLDEVPVAFVVAADATSPPTLDELHRWCANRLTKSKRPRDITLVDALPRTSVGKIRKFLLRDPEAESAINREVSHDRSDR